MAEKQEKNEYSFSLNDISKYLNPQINSPKNIEAIYKIIYNLMQLNSMQKSNVGLKNFFNNKEIAEKMNLKEENGTVIMPNYEKFCANKDINLINIKAVNNFEVLSYSPFSKDNPRIPTLYDGAFSRITSGENYDNFVNTFKNTYRFQELCFEKFVLEKGPEFLKNLPPKVLANQKEKIDSLMQSRIENKISSVQNKIDEKLGKNIIVQNQDGTISTIHQDGLLDKSRANYQKAVNRIEELSNLLKDKNNTSAMVKEIKAEIKNQKGIAKQEQINRKTYEKQLKQDKKEFKATNKMCKAEMGQVGSIFGQRQVIKAEKVLNGEIKERLSLRDKVIDVKEKAEVEVLKLTAKKYEIKDNLRSDIQNLKEDPKAFAKEKLQEIKDGVRPLVKGAKEVISELSDKFKQKFVKNYNKTLENNEKEEIQFVSSASSIYQNVSEDNNLSETNSNTFTKTENNEKELNNNNDYSRRIEEFEVNFENSNTASQTTSQDANHEEQDSEIMSENVSSEEKPIKLNEEALNEIRNAFSNGQQPLENISQDGGQSM